MDLVKIFLYKNEMNQKLNIRVCGKWILAGEYAVLKGFSALAFPLPSQFMELKFSPSTEKSLELKSLTHISSETHSKERLQIFFESIFQEALKIVSKQSAQLTGLLELNSYMLSGSGLGSSSVVSVLIGKLFYALEWIQKEELFSFCHALERCLQKGESSGLDIRVILERQAILYKNPSHWDFFYPAWEPAIYLSYSGQGQNTDTNIQNTQKLWKEEPHKMKELNQKMSEAVLKAKNSLEQKVDTTPGSRLEELKQAFFMAEDCFFQWNLIGENLRTHIQLLKQQGALAVKPTGSGSGGYVLSLWPSPNLPQALQNKLFSAF